MPLNNILPDTEFIRAALQVGIGKTDIFATDCCIVPGYHNERYIFSKRSVAWHAGGAVYNLYLFTETGQEVASAEYLKTV